MNDVVLNYYKKRNHRKLIQSLVPYFNHQNLPLRLEAHAFLVYYAKLCGTDHSAVPYSYRLFLIYQTLISVQCDQSEDVRRICIKALFIWIVSCSDDIIVHDLESKALSMKDITPLILCSVGISDLCPANRVVVFHQINQLLLDPNSKHSSFLTQLQWFQMFYKKPIKTLSVESVTDRIPLYYKPLLNDGKLLFLHTSLARNYQDLLQSGHIFHESRISPYLFIHHDALKRASCGLFSHVLDDEMRECRIAAIHTLSSFAKHMITCIVTRRRLDNKCIEIAVTVNRGNDAEGDGADTSETKIEFDGGESSEIDILSRCLSFISDLLNDESGRVRALTLETMRDLMVFGRDSLRIGDDFLPLIQIMTGDYIESTRCGAYQCLQYLFLSRPRSLWSCIKSLSASIVRYPKDQVPLLYAVAVLSYRHSRLLEPIWTQLLNEYDPLTLSVSNLKHLCLAVILFYGQQSNDYLTESLPSPMTQFITACKLKRGPLFEYEMVDIVTSHSTDSHFNSVIDDVSNWNLYGSPLLTLNGYLEGLFASKSCDFKAMNQMIRSLQNLESTKDIDRVDRVLSLWRILRDIMQCIELALCGGTVPSKVVQSEHDCVLLHRMCSGRYQNLCNLLFAAKRCLYLVVVAQQKNATETIKKEDAVTLNLNGLDRYLEALNAGKMTLWQCLCAVWKEQMKGGDVMKALKEYVQCLDTLKRSDPIGKRLSLKEVIGLKAEPKIYFHPLTPIDIDIQCVVIPQYARHIRPKLKVTVIPRSSKMETKAMKMSFVIFSKKRWMKEVDADNYVTFQLRLPSLTPSTNINPAKNYYADVHVQMVSDLKAIPSVIPQLIPDCDSDIVISNTLTVFIAIGAS